MIILIRRWLVLLALTLALQPASFAQAAQETTEPQAVKSGRVLVIGATGRQGGAVARELLGRGFQVRGLTRDPERPAALALTGLGAQMVRGDLDDAASLEEALSGVDKVFVMTDFFEHGYDGEVRHGRRIIDAAKAANVRHLVFSSAGNADRKTGIAHFESKLEIERYLAASGVPFTILRPVAFMEDWASASSRISAGELHDPLRSDARMQYISVRDVARFVAEAFEHPAHWTGRAVDIAADELTIGEFAQLLSRVSGRAIVHKQIPWEDFERQAGEEITRMMRWFDAVGFNVNVKALRARYPWLIRFEDYLRQSSDLAER